MTSTSKSIGGLVPDYDAFERRTSSSLLNEDEDNDNSAMADNNLGSEPFLRSGQRRVSTDPIHSPATMDGASRDKEQKEPHKVRFSEDLDRAPVGAQRLDTPNLTLDTTVIPRRSVSTGLHPRKPQSPTSPTSPRTRDRGYSLR